MMELLSCKLYSAGQSDRLRYVAELIQLCWPNVLVKLENQPSEPDAQCLALSYGMREESYLYIPDDGLLWERSIRSMDSPLIEWPGNSKSVPLDVLSAIFYVATRYEEYIRSDKDEHGRHRGSGSDLDKINLLDIPAVPYWLEKLCILAGFKTPKAPVNKYLSCDIDQAYKYKYRGGLRSLIGAIKSDPYDSYDLLKQKADEYGYDLHYFIPAASEFTHYDEAQSPAHGYMRELGQRLSKQGNLGWHPGYYSADNEELLRKEKQLLEQNWNIKIDHARMHYLRVLLPTTYRLLSEIGIKHEYSMGYADRSGWRSGMHLAFPWYDLEHDLMTDLIIHPLVFMDVTIKNYQKLTSTDLGAYATRLKESLKMYGGDWSVLWHNTSFDVKEGWPGDTRWLDLFLDI